MDVFAMLEDVLAVKFGDLYRDLLNIYSLLQTQFLRTSVFLVDKKRGWKFELLTMICLSCWAYILHLEAIKKPSKVALVAEKVQL